MSKIITLNNENFAKEIINYPGVALVDFWADWCGPCKMQLPILDELASEVAYKIGKVNVDECGDIAAEYGIRSIPTLFIFKDGKIEHKFVGLKQKNELKAELDKVAAK